MKVSELVEILKHENQDNEISMILDFTINDRRLPCGFLSINKMKDKDGYLHDRGKSIFIVELKKEDDEKYIHRMLWQEKKF